MMYIRDVPRSSPRKRLHPLRHTSPRRSVRASFPGTKDEESHLGCWRSKQRKSGRNIDICILADDGPTKQTRLNHSSAAHSSSERQLPALTPEMESIIDDALAPKSAKEVLCEGFNITLTREDLKILHGEEWLSDQIISFYLSLIVERSKRRRFPSVFAFSTFFFTKLHSGGHPAVQRWTRKVDLFSFDIILIPVHKKKGHWCLAIVDFRCKKILYYDPMKKTNYKCLYSLREYLKAESLDKKNTVFDTSNWKYENVKNVPTQESDNDCGVFILKYAEYYCTNTNVDFTQDDVQYFRKCMVYELLVKKLLK